MSRMPFSTGPADPGRFTGPPPGNCATSYTRGGQSASRASLAVGTFVRATGTVDPDRTEP